ncbi:hypothetical protein A2Y85_05800 [candidate division WOR-3 bacterium RBG_13_43_14]|uniref:TRAM domain-containing protein n=1 Tax=candidate division WOR-3 bacterium RBG_13_43_14 TaxID=1802590 RepID=A0A1F4U5B3_UNCW3|nr:MAG: hypothetical protein A2Y85_05800 [candidate division WOR-3 bacterium RBG_13_43_14]
MLFFKREHRYVLDSASIIDGRVIQLFDRKYFEGRILIPTLVRYLVRKFDGPKGERSIGILKRNASIDFVRDKDGGMSEELVVLKIAQLRNAKLFTVSDEVCRQARLFPNVKLIDIRELYRVLTPIFTPQKTIYVRILKRGLNSNEGVGYIEGVKIVVENGGKYLNQIVAAKVSTMLSLETGNLVFCRIDERNDAGFSAQSDSSIKTEK